MGPFLGPSRFAYTTHCARHTQTETDRQLTWSPLLFAPLRLSWTGMGPTDLRTGTTALAAVVATATMKRDREAEEEAVATGTVTTAMASPTIATTGTASHRCLRMRWRTTVVTHHKNQFEILPAILDRRSSSSSCLTSCFYLRYRLALLSLLTKNECLLACMQGEGDVSS